jgi:UPF0271 protein
MANMASRDINMARACYDAALSVAPDLIVMVLAGTAQQAAVEKLGCKWAGEIFADRAYNDDATLVDRRLNGAVIHDPDLAARRMVNMVQNGAIITENGQKVPAAVDTICLHGDGATALAIARAVRDALRSEGIALKAFKARG